MFYIRPNSSTPPGPRWCLITLACLQQKSCLVSLAKNFPTLLVTSVCWPPPFSLAESSLWSSESDPVSLSYCKPRRSSPGWSLPCHFKKCQNTIFLYRLRESAYPGWHLEYISDLLLDSRFPDSGSLFFPDATMSLCLQKYTIKKQFMLYLG